MGLSCSVCNHSKRLEIDREIAQGKSYSGIARSYGLHNEAVRRHAENHLSRQLRQAYELKEREHGMDLLNRIDEILNKAESIFQRNYDKGKDKIALQALSEQRNTIELLAKVSYYLHEAKRLEAEAQQAELYGPEQQVHTIEFVNNDDDDEEDDPLPRPRSRRRGQDEEQESPYTGRSTGLNSTEKRSQGPSPTPPPAQEPESSPAPKMRRKKRIQDPRPQAEKDLDTQARPVDPGRRAMREMDGNTPPPDPDGKFHP